MKRRSTLAFLGVLLTLPLHGCRGDLHVEEAAPSAVKVPLERGAILIDFDSQPLPEEAEVTGEYPRGSGIDWSCVAKVGTRSGRKPLQGVYGEFLTGEPDTQS